MISGYAACMREAARGAGAAYLHLQAAWISALAKARRNAPSFFGNRTTAII